MQKTTSAYTAATIDSDGCIGIYWTTDHYALCVTVANTNYTLLEWLKRKWKGQVSKEHQYKPSKPFKQYRVVGYAAISLLKSCLPYFIVKKRQALLGLKFMSIRPGLRIKRGLKYANLCKELNK